MSVWISVKERLPDNQDDILVVAYWHKRWQTMIGWFGAKISKEWRVITPQGERHPDSVTHWMPLPKPPRDEIMECDSCRYQNDCLLAQSDLVKKCKCYEPKK